MQGSYSDNGILERLGKSKLAKSIGFAGLLMGAAMGPIGCSEKEMEAKAGVYKPKNSDWIIPGPVDKNKEGEYTYNFNDAEQALLAFTESVAQEDPDLYYMLMTKSGEYDIRATAIATGKPREKCIEMHLRNVKKFFRISKYRIKEIEMNGNECKLYTEVVAEELDNPLITNYKTIAETVPFHFQKYTGGWKIDLEK